MTCHQTILSFLFGREGKINKNFEKSSSLKGQIAGFQPHGKPAIAVKQKNIYFSVADFALKKSSIFFLAEGNTFVFVHQHGSLIQALRLSGSRNSLLKARTRRHPFLRASAYTSRELHLRISENVLGSLSWGALISILKTDISYSHKTFWDISLFLHEIFKYRVLKYLQFLMKKIIRRAWEGLELKA